jgi:hypothetical protein
MTGKNKPRPGRLVQRYYSDRYLLLTVISFALSVSLTRLFLEITGYPQLGGSQLHFSHVLWGGLILFAGSLFPLIYANHRALDISAVLTGVGAGLFIDEVGKFITRTNNYFYPAAAPIVYSFFLITLFIFFIIRKERKLTLRERLFQVIEQFEEVLEGDLSKQEKDQMIAELSETPQSEDSSELNSLAISFRKIIAERNQNLEIEQPKGLEKISRWWFRMRAKIFLQNMKPIWLFTLWFVLGLISIIHPLASFYAAKLGFTLKGFWNELIKLNLDPDQTIGIVERLRLSGEAFIGFFLIFSSGAGFFGAKKFGATVAYISLLIQIVFVNLLVFFFDQFSAIVFTIIQFMTLFLTRQYLLILDS